MIVCVDVGGTKTLLGLAEPASERPKFITTTRVNTPATYQELLEEIAQFVHTQDNEIDTISIGYPGRVNPDEKRIVRAQNIAWDEAPIGADIQKILPDVKHVFVENDGNLGGLAEATSGAGADYSRVYYLTISTGIGGGYIVNGAIDRNIGNSEPGHMVLEDNTLFSTWETLASGKAFFDTYGQTATDTPRENPNWAPYSRSLVPGFINIIALCNPDVIIVGGGIGTHFDKWWPHLNKQLQQHAPAFLELPTIKAAHHAERAVLEGAFYYAK